MTHDTTDWCWGGRKVKSDWVSEEGWIKWQETKVAGYEYLFDHFRIYVVVMDVSVK